MAQHEENETSAEAEEQQVAPETEEKPATDPVKQWTWRILAIAAGLLVWHLAADRLTPYTSQARVHALVVPVAPEVSGIVTFVGVSNNQAVEKGQVLFRIDTEQYELALQNAKAKLLSARAGLEKAKKDAMRLRRIKKQDPGAISDRRLEQAEASLESARGRVQAAVVVVDNARLNLERTTVRAPEKGVVTDMAINRGHFAAAGQPLMTFIAVRNIWLQADMTENNLGHIRPGSKVLIAFDILPGDVYEGSVRELGFGVAVDSAPPGTLPSIDNDRSWLRAAQRFPVLIDFDYPGGGKQLTLRVGSQASVVVLTGDHLLLNTLARLYIRLLSILSYAY